MIRFRPVLMTALAMIIGMAPMALGLGEGGEQNAPLGRAVIGGLIVATCATLFFVPALFSLVHGRQAGAEPRRRPSSSVPFQHLIHRRVLMPDTFVEALPPPRSRRSGDPGCARHSSQ